MQTGGDRQDEKGDEIMNGRGKIEKPKYAPTRLHNRKFASRNSCRPSYVITQIR